MTLHQRLAEARTRLVGAGFRPDDAAVDVDVLARGSLGWDRARLLTEMNTPVPSGLEPQFSQWIERRLLREPVAYILGVREFWGLELRVTSAVLIPRPETEFIVEEALPLLRQLDQPHLADIGTGSGCLAIALAHEVRNAQIVATDLSNEALDVARANAIRLGVGPQIEFVQTSYLDGIDTPLDVIVANPPYVREVDKRGLSRDVRHEPDVALFGGSSGLRDLGGVLDAALRALKPAGWLLTEFGYGQEDDVRQLIADRPALRLDRVRDDLQGIARTAIIQRS